MKDKRIKRNRRLKGAGGALVLFLLLACGCSDEGVETAENTEEISIPVILIVDSSTGIRNEEKVIRAFNQEYEGKWQTDVE